MVKEGYGIVLTDTGKTYLPQNGVWTRAEASRTLKSLQKDKPWKFGKGVVRKYSFLTIKRRK